MARVLLTGATGFLGPHVAHALAAAGWEVRAALRDEARPPIGDERVVVGEIDGGTDWRAALAGVEAVVHLAGRAHQGAGDADREAHLRINRDGTARLAEAAAGRVRRFVYISTALVHGAASPGRPLRETDPLRPASAYAESKAAAEERLRELQATAGLSLTVLRPPLIYGTGAKGNFATLCRAVAAGLPLPLRSIVNRRAFAAAENVAAAVRHALGSAGAGTVFVADCEQVSTPRFVELTAAALGTRARLWPLPPALLRAALRAAGRGQMAASLCDSLELDPAGARAWGWTPVVELAEGLRRAVGSAQQPPHA